jgi:hypothetical protein
MRGKVHDEVTAICRVQNERLVVVASTSAPYLGVPASNFALSIDVVYNV